MDVEEIAIIDVLGLPIMARPTLSDVAESAVPVPVRLGVIPVGKRVFPSDDIF